MLYPLFYCTYFHKRVYNLHLIANLYEICFLKYINMFTVHRYTFINTFIFLYLKITCQPVNIKSEKNRKKVKWGERYG